MGTKEKAKTANEIIKQFARIRDEYDKNLIAGTSYTNKARANMERASKITARYLTNIANYLNLPYCMQTWKDTDGIKVNVSIYSK